MDFIDGYYIFYYMVNRPHAWLKVCFWVCLNLYFLVLIAREINIKLPHFINDYYGDLICIPMVLSITQKLIRIIQQNPNFLIQKTMNITVVVYFSLMFEWILPIYSDRYTSDWIDVICYVAGGFVFFILNNLFQSRTTNSV